MSRLGGHSALVAGMILLLAGRHGGLAQPGPGPTAQGTGQPLERLELDRRIVTTVYETALLGTRAIGPSRVITVGLPRRCCTRWAKPNMLPRLSGSGWMWETKITRLAACKPCKKRSERRRPLPQRPLQSGSALRRAIDVFTSGLPSVPPWTRLWKPCPPT